ncbi:hypothetical protein ACFQT0_19575 [Hymenobacter humi]|uniref:Uncharacterized protein n=1 Tax=Hymenobacter humi TaxID=1411620 RepID=A0ABW2UAR3_9BACT
MPDATAALLQPFLEKWRLKFADNEYQNITEATFREFSEDIDRTFVQSLTDLEDLGAHPLTPLVLPMAVRQGAWYITGTGIWEAKSAFTAQSAPAAGTWWLNVAMFTGELPPATMLTAASISDATAAGRAMLKAADAAAQLQLVDSFVVAANSQGGLIQLSPGLMGPRGR